MLLYSFERLCNIEIIQGLKREFADETNAKFVFPFKLFLLWRKGFRISPQEGNRGLKGFSMPAIQEFAAHKSNH